MELILGVWLWQQQKKEDCPHAKLKKVSFKWKCTQKRKYPELKNVSFFLFPKEAELEENGLILEGKTWKAKGKLS